MTEDNFNMSEFHHSILLKAPLKEVYKYFATPAGLKKWFMGTAEYISKEGLARKPDEFICAGDNYHWKWLEKDFEVKGTVLEVTQNQSVRFSFGALFVLTISAGEQNGRTLFTLKQEYAPGAAKNDFTHINCCVCWAFFVTNIKSVIEHGFDLRETEAHEESLVNR